MGYYNVVRPCVVGVLHYTRVPAQPIVVADAVAAPLVESGDLTPYRASVQLDDSAAAGVAAGNEFVESVTPGAPAGEHPDKPHRSRRKPATG